MTQMLVMVFVHTTMEQQRSENHSAASANNSTGASIPAPIVSGFAYAAGIMARCVEITDFN